MESFLRNLTKQVTCSICLDAFNNPKIISCFHTFCCECLEKHVRRNHKQGKFRCPECQAEIDLPEGNRFDRLPTSFFHNSLLNLLAVRQSGDGTNITCGNCKKRSSNVHYCFDCVRFLCSDRCLTAHEIMRDAFEGHKVMPVKDFQAQDYETLLKRQSFCSKKNHEREITRFFCVQCQSCVCHLCIVTDHQNHKVNLLDEAADNEKANIMADAALSREREKDLTDMIGQFEETASKLENNAEIATRGVTQAAEQMITEIREREREAIASIETTRVTRLDRINSAKQQVESLTKQNKKVADFAETVVQRSSSWDVMQNKITLKQRFEELRGVQAVRHHQTSFIKFYAAAVMGFKLGDIAIKGAHANQSTLEGLDQILQAGVEAEFILSPKTAEGEISNQPDLKQQIEVTIDPTEDVTDVSVGETENGRFKVKFTPKVPGAYSIEVKINGDKLPTCPFTVQVKERELTVVGKLDLKLFKGEQLKGLEGIAVNTKGMIAITDSKGHCVYILDKECKCLRKFGSEGRKAGQFSFPYGVTYLNDDEILIADAGNNRIQQVDVQTGTVLKSFGNIFEQQFNFPIDVSLDEERHIVVTEDGNNRIQVMSREGESISIFGDSGPGKLRCPTSCISYKNMFFVSDRDNHCIKTFDQSGTFLYKFGKQWNQEGQFSSLRGLLVDSKNNLLFCDNKRVQQFSLDGRFTGESITKIPKPIGIATTPDGRILVTSHTSNKVYVLK